MTRSVKLISLLLAAVLTAPFFIKGPDGRPLLSWDRLHMPAVTLPDLGSAVNPLKHGLSGDEEPRSVPVQVFKWQDERGIWHYSDDPMPGQKAQSLTVDPNANLSHYEPKAPEAAPRQAQTAPAEKNAADGVATPFPASIPLDKIPTLINDAKNVGKLQQQRLERQEQALGN